MRRLDERIRRSKRMGKIAVLVVLAVSLLLGPILFQALGVARSTDRDDVATLASVGIWTLVFLNLFSIGMAWRQHRLLDEARSELDELVQGPAEAGTGDGSGADDAA